jgi:hypothetical protein
MCASAMELRAYAREILHAFNYGGLEARRLSRGKLQARRSRISNRGDYLCSMLGWGPCNSPLGSSQPFN